MEEQVVVDNRDKKENNIKIYKFYRVFSWDMLFYYAIIYLFLTIEKGITPAQFLEFDAFYIFFKFLVQIPCTLMIQKIGKRNSLVFANLIGAAHILIIILAKDYSMLIFSQFLCAIAFIIKGTCETDMLYDSLEHNEERGHRFAKIDGKANSRYYYIDAISSLVAGFLFIVNPYIPIILCFITLFATFILSTKFEDIHTEKKKMHIREEIKNIRYGFKNIFKSKRLLCLVLFNAVFVAYIKIISNIRNTILFDINIPEYYFGIIFAIIGIVTSILARNQGKLHKQFRNKTLAFIALPATVSCLLIGLVLLCDFSRVFTVFFILTLIVVATSVKGPYYVLIKQYLNNFTNSDKRIQIATVNNKIENLVSAIFLFASAYILDNLSVTFTTITIGSMFVVLLVLLLDFMRNRVGLKPDDYSKKDIL